MNLIPTGVQELIQREKVIVVGSVDKKGMSNTSPRSAISLTNNAIYWLDFFDHKSRKNFRYTPWVSVAVFDKHKQLGFQLKGKVSFLTGAKKNKWVYKIMKSLPNRISEVYKELTDINALDVIEFKPKAIYSLNPRQNAGRELIMDKDKETIAMLGN